MKQPVGQILDPRLGQWLTVKSLRTLRLCPVDEFFTAQSHKLHGSTLKYLADRGYLNRETSKDGLHLEYYLNNHGHRLRRMHMDEFDHISVEQ